MCIKCNNIYYLWTGAQIYLEIWSGTQMFSLIILPAFNLSLIRV